MRSLFHTNEESSESETIDGVDVLKAIWNIPGKTVGREMPPADVGTDIYNTPRPGVPQRPRPSR